MSFESSLWASALILGFLVWFIGDEDFRNGVLFLALMGGALIAVALPIWWLS